MYTQDGATTPFLSNFLRELSAHVCRRHIPDSVRANNGTHLPTTHKNKAQ